MMNAQKLNRFRERVGIIDVTDLGSRAKGRPAPNVGIYKRIASEERKAKLEYYACALLINACLLAQVIFASALTALGAGHGSHNQITGLGVANTVVAAILTFTKGSGLPNSLRQYQQLLRKVREYIEQKERDFAQSDCKLGVDLEMQRIKEMYDEARQIHENNDTSTYNKPAVAPGQDKPLATKLTRDQPLSSPKGSDSPIHTLRSPMRAGSEGNEAGDKSEDAHTQVTVTNLTRSISELGLRQIADPYPQTRRLRAVEYRSSSSQQAGVEQASVVMFADMLGMSSVWHSVDTGVRPASTIIDCVGCNYCLLSSYLCVWKPTTVCPQIVSVQLLAIIKSRLSFAADVPGHLLCSPYATTFALSRLLASAAHCSKFPHSEKFSRPIPASPSFCPVKTTFFTMSPPTHPTFQIHSHRQNGGIHRRKRPKIQLLRRCSAAPGIPPYCRRFFRLLSRQQGQPIM